MGNKNLRPAAGPTGLPAMGAVLAVMLGLALSPLPAAAQSQLIGAVLPESWPSTTQAEEMRLGMTLALKTSALQPGPRLVFKDSACDARKAAAAVQSFAAAKVDIVIGGFCVLGEMPAMLRAAGIPLVSANAERLKNGDGVLQLGRVAAGQADDLAARLRSQTGLRVTASSTCWIDYESPVSEKYDAGLCPVLQTDRARWAEVAPSFEVAFRRPFTASAARGYAAMEVALAYLKRVRSGSRQAALSEAQNQHTVLGALLPRDAGGTPDDALQLSLTAQSYKPGSREAKARDDLLKAKGCDCKAGPDCGKGTPWAGMPFTVLPPGAKPASCAPVVAAR